MYNQTEDKDWNKKKRYQGRIHYRRERSLD